MAYDKNKLLEMAIRAINNDPDVVFMQDVVSNMPCSESTFYAHFPVDSDELKYIKEHLEKNKVSIKQRLRSNWKNSESAPLQLALYKLVSTPDEARALSMQHIDHTSKGKTLTMPAFLRTDEQSD